MDAADRLLRWERAGGTWRVLAESTDAGLTVALDTCHGEEMERFTSAEAELAAFIGMRTTSDGQDSPVAPTSGGFAPRVVE